MYILILALIIGAGLGFIPANIARNKGYDNFGLWWFYGWMLFIVAIIHACSLKDKTAPQIPTYSNYTPPYYPPSAPKQSPIDELKKYKELLDQGIITEEEFQAKKEQLLKLM